MYWTVDSWKVVGGKVTAEIFMEDEECMHCGRRNDPTGIFEGQKV